LLLGRIGTLWMSRTNKLPPFMRRVSPPGYWKDEATGRGG